MTPPTRPQPPSRPAEKPPFQDPPSKPEPPKPEPGKPGKVDEAVAEKFFSEVDKPAVVLGSSARPVEPDGTFYDPDAGDPDVEPKHPAPKHKPLTDEERASALKELEKK